MPTYTKYAQLRTPLGPEADDVPGDLQQLAGGIDTLLNLKATDESDRDARYGDAPVGTLVSLTDRGQLHWKGPEGWRIVSRTPSTTESTLTPSSQDWSPSRSTVTVWSNGMARLYLTALYQGPTIQVPASGDMPNQQIGTIPAEFAPTGLPAGLSPAVTGRLSSGYVATDGGVWLTALAGGGGDLASGETVQLTGVWPL